MDIDINYPAIGLKCFGASLNAFLSAIVVNRFHAFIALMDGVFFVIHYY